VCGVGDVAVCIVGDGDGMKGSARVSVRVRVYS